jgi:hypothetical protein
MRAPAEGQRFEPETLLPCQYDDFIAAEASLQPEKRLMLAVLENAVATYQRFALATSRRGRRLFGEAEQWFLDREDAWLFSFQGICAGLGLEADFIRSGLGRWRDRAAATATPVPCRTPFRRVNASRHKVAGRAPGMHARGGTRSRPHVRG